MLGIVPTPPVVETKAANTIWWH